MKRFNWLLIGAVCFSLAMLPLTGCVSQSEYKALEAEKENLVEENNSLTAELEGVHSELVKVQLDYDTLKADCDELTNNYEAVNEELAEIKEFFPPRYFPSAVELQNWLAEDNISDRTSADAVLWYANARELQKRALEDGYIINAYIFESETPGYYNVYCDAVTEDDSLYWWDPETDDIYYELDVKHF